jgi:hypothetical protein
MEARKLYYPTKPQKIDEREMKKVFIIIPVIAIALFNSGSNKYTASDN